MGSLQPPEGTQNERDSIPGSSRIGPYRLLGEIGVGGMGDVYRAVDERHNRQVAIKYLQPPFARERFRLEAQAVAHLDHPAIIQVFDVIENEAGGWIVMELVEGRQLSSLIADGPLNLETALPIFADLAEALAEAHAKGVLHRDLKTDNVKVTPAGRAKLLDFGLARWIEPGDSRLTLDGQIIGTPHAMSPEQAMSLDLDHRSDIFSLGTLFYEATTGERPFHGAGLVETLRRVCVERQRPCHELSPRIPRQLSRLIDRMLEKEPERRPRTASAVAQAIRRLVGPRCAGPPRRALSGRQNAPPARETGLGQDSVSEVRDRKAPEDRAAASGEQNTVTVVHCQLAGSGSPPSAPDPEEQQAVRPELERLAARAAVRFEGEVGERLDRGLRMLFSDPRDPEGHGDGARRAVYAAREIVAGIEGLVTAAGEELVAEAGLGLGLRVGIHTGPAVADSGGDGRASGDPGVKLALGETGDLAAVLQGLAPPGEILLSAATHGVVSSFFDTEARSPARVPGLSERVVSYRWLGEAVSRKRSGR